MKNFVSLRIATLVLVTGYMLKTTSADADVTFLGVAAGDATTNDAIVWTHQATAGRLNKIRGSGRRRPLGKNF
jgi:phosphodiesterase/alkaline phosphatase D-like protein